MASIIPHLFLFLPPIIYAQSDSMLNIGSFLIAGDPSFSPWRSPADEFAFGFKQVQGDLFLLSIWYNKLDEQSIVWYAIHDQNPAPRGSRMEVTASNGLLLQSAQGGEPWKSSPISGVVAFGMIYDDGNLVLLGSNSTTLWESFKQPANILLPNQKIEVNGLLSSRKSQNSYALGKFQLRLFEGNLVLNIISLPSIYTYEPYHVIQAYEGNQIVFDKDGFLYIMQGNGKRVNISEPESTYPANAHYYQVTLNFDGVITVSHHTRNPSAFNATWMDFKKIPNNICVAMHGNSSSGVCGYNSICTLNNDQRPSCKCPPGYSLIDPNDKYGDCKPNIQPICEGGENNLTNNLYSLRVLPNTNWPTQDYELLRPSTVEECKNACLLDCFCLVAVYRDNSCWKKKLPLSNGREDSNETSVSYLKLRSTSSIGQGFDLPILKVKKKRNTLVLVLSTLLGGFVLIVLVLVSLICRGYNFNHKKKLMGDFHPRERFGSSMQKFTFKELSEATNEFEEELGRGSCGIVYKGTIEVGPIAVKKFNMSEDGEKEFKTEINVVGQTHHKNIVRLFGYCDDRKTCILVYEFMSNDNLARFLFSDTKLSWDIRTKISYGIARGLSYLHDECNTQIIHCDIKPQNVLLDEYYNPKISDFGLAKLLKIDQSRKGVETNIKGTTGYIAPDWFKSTPVTTKVDVYSFGVLLLEIICCRRNGEDVEVCEEGREILVDWAYDCLQQGRLNVVVEEDLEAIDDMERLERFVKVAIWCIQEDPYQRPTMKQVIYMLEGVVPVSTPPYPCPFSSIS